MPTKKILSIDDAKTVRLLIRKAMKPFDVVVCEAQNGEAGIAVARAEKPDVILLDVTMPVLDGVETLARLKADAELKKIPVVMLTAEAGREKVQQIARIGARDYIVKPFTEEVLLQKLRRILVLDPARDVAQERRLFVLVEDKLAIAKQIVDSVQDPAWIWRHVASADEALDIAEQGPIAAVVVSLSLSDDGALALLRNFRLRPNHATTPFIGLALKTAVDERNQAVQAGFAMVADKPIDPRDLEAKLRQVLKRDAGDHAVSISEEHLVVRLTEGMTESQYAAAQPQIRKLAAEAVESGIRVAVFNFAAVQNFTAELSKFVADGTRDCEQVGLRVVLLGSSALAEASRAFEEARDWQFHERLELASA